MHNTLALLALVIIAAVSVAAQQAEPRARDLGIPFDGTPGPFNAITDVAGVEVGFTTLISGSGKLVVGQGPVRTGVTAILPRGHKSFSDPVFAGWYSLNGNGEMTGTTWVEESGFLEGPVMITNTHSVGVVRDAVIAWRVQHGGPDQSGYWWSLPVVAETYDGSLNDINGFHVKPDHVFHALDTAAGGLVAEGNVGGGTGMVCHGFKGGTGSASRKLDAKAGGYIVGVLVQCNYGVQSELRIAGIPVGRELPPGIPRKEDSGSIIVVVATDAPLLPNQLKRLARRVSLGLGRLGSYSGDGSGDIFIAFSTANSGAWGAGVRDDNSPPNVKQVKMLSNDDQNPLLLATVQSVEEAVVNALIAAKSMKGINDFAVDAIPLAELQQVLRKYNRLSLVETQR
jgi:L-aminopeptidase/D-esterase-like protein